MQKLSKDLKHTRFRGWQFWYVQTIGEYNPVDMASNWSVIDVFDSYYNLRIKQAMEG